MLLSVLSILILSSCWIDMLRSEGEECCPLKEVGGKQYSFVDHITKEEARRLDCTSTCTYKYAEQSSEQRFCFKPGNLKSICPGKDRITFSIIMNNTSPFDVSGEIFYDDNTEQPYSVGPYDSEEITHNDASFIRRVTGQTADGIVCIPYIMDNTEDPKQIFKIVQIDQKQECQIVPSDDQYHSIGQTTWYENGEIVNQEDHFHPGTREAVLKTWAHGKNQDTTTIFQAKESTNSRRSTGFGLMVTAYGHECHVNHLTDALGINPEHITIPRDQSSGRDAAIETVDTYVRNFIAYHTVIYPDDNMVKLTETMKKACEQKTIFYHTEHLLESGEDFKLGVSKVSKKNRQIFETMLSQNYINSARQARNVCPVSKVQTKFSQTEVLNCGVWSYGGVTDTSNGFLPPAPVTVVNHHLRQTWTVAAQCCDQQGTDFFPCDSIPDDATEEAEQAFSTAFALSLGLYYNLGGDNSPYCIGMSRYCEWKGDDTTYANIGVTGACTSHCNDHCSGYKVFDKPNSINYPNGCFKCYGMYPGFYDPVDRYKRMPGLTYAFWGPCKSPVCQDRSNCHSSQAICPTNQILTDPNPNYDYDDDDCDCEEKYCNFDFSG